MVYKTSALPPSYRGCWRCTTEPTTLRNCFGLCRETAHSLRVSRHVLSGPPDHERRLICGANPQAISLGKHAQGLEEAALHRSGQKQWPGHTSVRMCIDQHTHTPHGTGQNRRTSRARSGGRALRLQFVTMAVTLAAALPPRHTQQPEVRMAEASTGD